jgi:ABC-2 type transport system ATP-binding protein
MDEAERCHFLAILDEGRKVADGTPEQLKNEIAATVVEIELEEPRRGHHVLAETTGVVSIAQLGALLRAHVEPGAADPVDVVSHALSGAGVDARARAVDPTLEDVFMAVTR